MQKNAVLTAKLLLSSKKRKDFAKTISATSGKRNVFALVLCSIAL